MTFTCSAASPAQFPRDGLPEIAFLGRSNVGKSSLLNALARVKNLARVSATPGRTRLLNFFRVADDFYLTDLPGYGYARVPQHVRRDWEPLIRSYLEGRAVLALCILLVDGRHEPTDTDRSLSRYLDGLQRRYVVAATKTDKLGRGEVARRHAALCDGLGQNATEVLAVSATKRSGLNLLWNAIQGAAQAHRREVKDER